MSRGRKKKNQEPVKTDRPSVPAGSQLDRAMAKRGNEIKGALQEKYGRELVAGLTDRRVDKIEGFSWGVPSVNYICTERLDIGIVRGRIYEIFGPESSGKTTLCLQAIREVQKAGGVVMYIDAEHALDIKYAIKLGVNPDALLFSQPDYGEQGIDICADGVRQQVDLIVVDSVAALVPKAIMEASSEKAGIGQHARMLSPSIAKLSALTGKGRTAILFINQVRNKIGVMFGSPETTTGGNALKFYASCRLRTSLSTAQKNAIRGNTKLSGEKDARRMGSTGIIKCVKNKLASPFLECAVSLYYGRGFDGVMDAYLTAVRAGIAVKSSKGFRLEGEKEVIGFADLELSMPRLWDRLKTVDMSKIITLGGTENEDADE